MFTEFQGYILEAETQLQTLLRIAVGNNEVVSNTIMEVETELPERIFKKPRLSDYQERHKEFISWLLSVCTVSNNSQVEIKHIIDSGKEKGFSEKWIRELREEIFQEASWVKGARYINGLNLVAP